MTSLGKDQLKVLSPVTTPVGAVVNHVAGGVQQLGEKLGDKLSTGPVAQLTGQTSKVIVPLTSKLTDTTQALGATTRLGAPVDNLLT
ncbi:collagen-like triple helix repeat-containing protein, partial [Salmonella enterica subsp. enterica serovar Typhimurium]|nr:collagen-like triple helix repeat-containing protein [Salmonella enterica subsp. enterica serovar Typhimurium]